MVPAIHRSWAGSVYKSAGASLSVAVSSARSRGLRKPRNRKYNIRIGSPHAGKDTEEERDEPYFQTFGSFNVHSPNNSPRTRKRPHPALRRPPAWSIAKPTTQITIGVDPDVSPDKVKTAFGKLDPDQYGIPPVPMVIENDSGKAIRLDKLTAEYAGPNRDRGDATPARGCSLPAGARASRGDHRAGRQAEYPG